MTINLRSYQDKLQTEVFGAWNQGAVNVLAVLPTGGGKSLTAASIIHNFAQPTCLSVHRAELVQQLSEALASLGILHRIVASKETVQTCIAKHVQRFGRSFYHAQSPVGVASVQTLLSRKDDPGLVQWCNSIKLWVHDEAHHVLKNNTFGQGVELFPNARGLGVTATPLRCDRKSLGRAQSGVFDVMVEGPTMRELIEWGYLADYSYHAPPASIIMTAEDIGASGDYKADAVRKKSHTSKIVGDIVQHYMDLARGKLGITFVVDIETASDVANAFNAAGIPAAAVSGKTPTSVRNALMDKFRRRNILQLVNVDLFDEGLDVPGVEVVSMGRPTMSLGKYRQQAGRQTRPVYAEGFSLSTQEGRLAAIAAGPKPYGIIIDHVNNVTVHNGPPDAHRIWSLNAEEKGKRSKAADDAIPIRTCPKAPCWKPYVATLAACPHCGHKPEPASRSGPEFVDGDLIELSPEVLAKMRGEVKKVDGKVLIPQGVGEIAKRSIEKRWQERKESQQSLRDCIALWAGAWKDLKGATDSESYRRFWFTFGKTDVLTAMTLGKGEAAELETRIRNELREKFGVDTQREAA